MHRPAVFVIVALSSLTAYSQPDPCARFYGLEIKDVSTPAEFYAYSRCAPAVYEEKRRREGAEKKQAAEREARPVLAVQHTPEAACRELQALLPMQRGRRDTVERRRDALVIDHHRKEVLAGAEDVLLDAPSSQPSQPNRELLERLREMQRQVACDVADREIKRVAERIGAAVKFLEAAQSAYDEARCQASPECMKKRREDAISDAAGAVCEVIDKRSEVLGEMATEKRYSRRAGVVNLGKLEDLKQQLRELDEQLVEVKAQFRETAGKPFSPKRWDCSKLSHE